MSEWMMFSFLMAGVFLQMMAYSFGYYKGQSDLAREAAEKGWLSERHERKPS